MADSSLDDFFAKKDKSKRGKLKAKYATSDTIAKKLEDSGGRIEPIQKKDTKEKIPLSTNNQSISIASTTNEQEDDEWKSIEEKERDYSGLRIQALSISDKEKEEEQLKEQMLFEQNGDSSKNADGQSGPWKVFQGPTPPVEEEEEEVINPPAEPDVKEEPAKPALYKAPGARNASLSTTGSSSHRRYAKNAPPIESEIHFPSLSAAVDAKFRLTEHDPSFQSVKHGLRSKVETQKEMQLDLGNKFSALPQGE